MPREPKEWVSIPGLQGRGRQARQTLIFYGNQLCVCVCVKSNCVSVCLCWRKVWQCDGTMAFIESPVGECLGRENSDVERAPKPRRTRPILRMLKLLSSPEKLCREREELAGRRYTCLGDQRSNCKELYQPSLDFTPRNQRNL